MSLTMRLFYLFFALSFTMAGCKPINNNASSSRVLVEDSTLRITLSPELARVESPLLLTLTGSDVVAVSGEIVGVSMYMGKVPLIFSHESGNWQAEFLLGACSDPRMKWQIILTVEFENGKKQTVKQELESSW